MKRKHWVLAGFFGLLACLLGLHIRFRGEVYDWVAAVLVWGLFGLAYGAYFFFSIQSQENEKASWFLY